MNFWALVSPVKPVKKKFEYQRFIHKIIEKAYGIYHEHI